MTTPANEKAAEAAQPKASGWAKMKSHLFKSSTSPDKGPALKDELAESHGKDVSPVQTQATTEPVPVAVEAPTTTKTSEGASPTVLPVVVKFEKVTKTFGSGPSARVALKEIDFAIDDLPNTGELISIVGPSGCGKSTLLRMIAGLEPHYPQTEGVIEVLGRKDNLLPSWERGLVDQKYSLFPHLTVRGNVMFGLDIRGESRSTRGDKADLWIKKVGLEGNEDKYPQELSGGMQQRVAIAATLVLGPRILLMDEPFGALDPKTRLRMQELLVQLWNEQQSTVFIVTHSVEEALYLGDRVFRMGAQPGRLLEILQAPRPEIPPEEMRQKKWFVEMTRDLLSRLEQDRLAGGELSSYQDFKREQTSRPAKP